MLRRELVINRANVYLRFNPLTHTHTHTPTHTHSYNYTKYITGDNRPRYPM